MGDSAHHKLFLRVKKSNAVAHRNVKNNPDVLCNLREEVGCIHSEERVNNVGAFLIDTDAYAEPQTTTHTGNI